MKNVATILLFIMMLPVMSLGDEYQDGYNAGKAAANVVSNEINTGDKINKKLSMPMTDEEAPLTTFGPQSQQESMHIEITSQSSNEFLKVTASPSNRGDIRNMRVEVDTNFDGTLDSIYSVPFTVSGVCANGLISCSASTWNNCRYYVWEYSRQTGIRAVPVNTQDELRGCYCINASCNSTITFTDMPLVLKDLGGAIAGAIQEYSPNYTITRVEAVGNTIKYYGQNSGAIDSNRDIYFSGESNPETLYDSNNDSALKARNITHANRQSNDPNSFYTNLSSSYENIEQPVRAKVCIIRYSISFPGGGNSQPVVMHSDSCAGEDFTGCRLKEEYICDYSGVNCVQTFANFNPTQEDPITYCEQMAPYTFCNDGTTIRELGLGVLFAGPETWFYTRRVYQCQEQNQSYEADEPLQRTAHVSESVDLSGSTVTYEDYDPQAGTVLQQGFSYPESEELECELACKIMRPIENTNVLHEGIVTDFKTDNESFQYIVEPCDENGVCPTEPGDTIVTECECISSFHEMVSIMEGLKMASDDMVCSQE